MNCRKLIATLGAAMLALTLAGCSSSSGSVSASASGSQNSSTSSAASSSSSVVAPAFDSVTVVDDEKFVIRVDAMGSDPNYIENYGFVCYLENKTDSKVKFTYEDGSFSVDGAMMTPKFFHDVMPGKHDNKAYLVFWRKTASPDSISSRTSKA